MKLNQLSPEEAAVIINRGTEPPFVNEYDEHFALGAYECRQCGNLLFSSQAKFRSGCGWPSFDDCFSGAVREQLDADGIRTEITCAQCGGHLGHAFRGEHMTPKDTRHCVNSLAIRFVPQAQV